MSKKAPKKAAKKPATLKSKVKSQKSKAGVKTAKTKASKKQAKKTAVKKTVVKKVTAKKTVAKKAAPKKTKKKIVKKTIAPFAKAPVKKVITDYPELLKAIVEGLEERKAKNISVINLTGISNRSFDYFVVADADSSTHVESIAASVEDEVKKKLQERPYHTEGWQNAEWILLDYINIVVHVFQRPVREFYNLEGLWADAEVQKIN
ncbi:MAG TPA: ribosome silencing factor [Bacteroidia bacterium]|jgi:ribosome-associated protein|nr:ribosome silencing factor [Bacteroidia bacterium]